MSVYILEKGCCSFFAQEKQIHPLRASQNMLVSDDIELVLRCLTKSQLEHALPERSFLYMQKCSHLRMDDAVHTMSPTGQGHVLHAAKNMKESLIHEKSDR